VRRALLLMLDDPARASFADWRLIEAFQNTRRRPITDAESATVWKEFDAAWRELERGRGN
jgi:hypothetical protein